MAASALIKNSTVRYISYIIASVLVLGALATTVYFANKGWNTHGSDDGSETSTVQTNNDNSNAEGKSNHRYVEPGLPSESPIYPRSTTLNVPPVNNVPPQTGSQSGSPINPTKTTFQRPSSRRGSHSSGAGGKTPVTGTQPQGNNVPPQTGSQSGSPIDPTKQPAGSNDGTSGSNNVQSVPSTRTIFPTNPASGASATNTAPEVSGNCVFVVRMGLTASKIFVDIYSQEDAASMQHLYKFNGGNKIPMMEALIYEDTTGEGATAQFKDWKENTMESFINDYASIFRPELATVELLKLHKLPVLMSLGTANNRSSVLTSLSGKESDLGEYKMESKEILHSLENVNSPNFIQMLQAAYGNKLLVIRAFNVQPAVPSQSPPVGANLPGNTPTGATVPGITPEQLCLTVEIELANPSNIRAKVVQVGNVMAPEEFRDEDNSRIPTGDIAMNIPLDEVFKNKVVMPTSMRILEISDILLEPRSQTYRHINDRNRIKGIYRDHYEGMQIGFVNHPGVTESGKMQYTLMASIYDRLLTDKEFAKSYLGRLDKIMASNVYKFLKPILNHRLTTYDQEIDIDAIFKAAMEEARYICKKQKKMKNMPTADPNATNWNLLTDIMKSESFYSEDPSKQSASQCGRWEFLRLLFITNTLSNCFCEKTFVPSYFWKTDSITNIFEDWYKTKATDNQKADNAQNIFITFLENNVEILKNIIRDSEFENYINTIYEDKPFVYIRTIADILGIDICMLDCTSTGLLTTTKEKRPMAISIFEASDKLKAQPTKSAKQFFYKIIPCVRKPTKPLVDPSIYLLHCNRIDRKAAPTSNSLPFHANRTAGAITYPVLQNQ